MKIEIKEPKVCGECLFYREEDYRCHNERGKEAYCMLGSMRGFDMRDKSYKDRMFSCCKLKELKVD